MQAPATSTIRHERSAARFVILKHVSGVASKSTFVTHFDWMFEYESTLRTWATAVSEFNPPRWCPGKRPLPADLIQVDCDRLADHRLAYLEYEGRISGDRGSVTKREQGTFAIVQSSLDRFGSLDRFEIKMLLEEQSVSDQRTVKLCSLQACFYRVCPDESASDASDAWRLELLSSG